MGRPRSDPEYGIGTALEAQVKAGKRGHGGGSHDLITNGRHDALLDYRDLLIRVANLADKRLGKDIFGGIWNTLFQNQQDCDWIDIGFSADPDINADFVSVGLFGLQCLQWFVGVSSPPLRIYSSSVCVCVFSFIF